MPWKVSRIVNERMKLVVRLEQGERMSDLCKEFGISRKTGYKFLERYKRFGAVGLYDEPRAPIVSPTSTPAAVRDLILKLKDKYPTWGAKKLFQIIKLKHNSEFPLPSSMTIHRILYKAGKVQKKAARRRGETFYSNASQMVTGPNDIWSMDFKGQFKVQDLKLCYPLTVSDHCSRFLLGCETLESTCSKPTEYVLEMIFRECGLPRAMLSDNGCPFGAPNGIFGLSKISIWLMKLGIEIMRIEPGHPEQNGRHERMHLTLKKATARPPAATLLAQQERFDRFRQEYNFERPHESLNMNTPASVWTKSERIFPNLIPDPTYPTHDLVRSVYKDGHIRVPNKRQFFFLGAAFSGEKIGLREEDEDIWRVSFMNYDLGFVDVKTNVFKPLEKITPI